MIVITGGGTGGHLSIARAIKIECNKRNVFPIFIGSTNGQDRAWFEHDELWSKKVFLSSSGVMNKGFFGKFKSLFHIIKLAVSLQKIYKDLGVKKVFCVGGYSSAPASIAAIITRTPLYIHEQNSVKGRLNTILKPFAKKLFSSFDDFSYPISDDKFNYKLRHKLHTIIFLGGSQGAKSINDLATQLCEFLQSLNIKIIHQCGEKHVANIRKIYEKKGIKADVFGFCDNIDEKIANADLAIARSGASTVFELCKNGLPCIFVPYPFAQNNHQYYNALTLFKQDLCFLIEEKNLNPQKIKDLIEDDIDIKINKISQKLENIVKPQAKIIVDLLLSDY